MAKPKRERPPPQYSDPTPQRLAHAGADLHDNWKEAVAQGRRPPPVRLVTMRDHPLERMLARRQIDQRQYDAGNKLRTHYERIGGAGKMGSIDWEAIFAADPTNRLGGYRIGHDHKAFWNAIDLLGHIPAALVVSVVCEARTLESVAPDFGRHPTGYGLAVVGFQMGKHLSKLAHFWGL